MDGVNELVDEVRIEVLLGDGTRLIVLVDPLGEVPATDGPGSVVAADHAPVARGTIGAVVVLRVTNTSTRVVRVSSHYPIDRVNRRLEFDREAARGWRLDLPAGANERWAPGETKEVRLIPYRGTSSADAG